MRGDDGGCVDEVSHGDHELERVQNDDGEGGSEGN